MDENWFLPWESFVGAGEALQAPLAVRWVSTGSVREGENLVVAIASEGGNNRVITLSATPDPGTRVFREHVMGFDCGDCELASFSGAAAVATESSLYGSSDGGESYFEVAKLPEPANRLFISGGDVYARTGSGWLSARLLEGQALTPLTWSQQVVHIAETAALEVTDDEVRLRVGDELLTAERPCPAPAVDEPFASGRYDSRVIVACAGGAVAINEDFPHGPFSLWTLDGEVRWIGPSFHVATDTSWYSTTTQTAGHRVGAQTALAQGERVWGHAEGARAAFRVTSLGIGLTYVGMIVEP
jgi:hypothetical protein